MSIDALAASAEADIAEHTAGTDLALPELPNLTDAALERMQRWAKAASEVAHTVGPLVFTPFVPDAYRPKVDPRAPQEDKDAAREVAIATATGAVLFGFSLGFDPLVSLQQIYIVKGRPGMYAKAKVAVLINNGHEVWTEELDDDHAVVCARRKGSDRVERVSITMEQARKAGWTSNEAYSKTPQDMLWARAAGRACDRTAPDLLIGLRTVEDLPNLDEPIRVTATTGEPQPPALTGADIIAQTATEPAMPPPAMPEPERVEPKPAEAALKRVFALLKQTGLGDRDAALAYISELVGRDIASRNDLTASEVRQVTAALEVRAEGA